MQDTDNLSLRHPVSAPLLSTYLRVAAQATDSSIALSPLLREQSPWALGILQQGSGSIVFRVKSHVPELWEHCPNPLKANSGPTGRASSQSS